LVTVARGETIVGYCKSNISREGDGNGITGRKKAGIKLLSATKLVKGGEKVVEHAGDGKAKETAWIASI